MLARTDLNSIPARCGWIAISREICDHPIVGFGRPMKPASPKRGSYSRAEAWLDLLMEANWQRRRESNKGKTVWIERGELMGARGWLAERWNWTESAVRVFLGALEGDSMIARKSSQSDGQKRAHFANIISICNYDTYQTAKELSALINDQSNSQSTANQQPINSQTLNKETRKQEEDIPPIVPLPGDAAPAAGGYDDLGDPAIAEEAPPPEKPKKAKKPKPVVPESYAENFEHWWKLYPETKRKTAKAKAFETWTRLTVEQQRHAYVALKRQLPTLEAAMRDRRGDFCPMPVTWLNQGRFEDTPAGPGGGDDFRHAKATYGASQLPAPLLQRWLEENDIRRRKGEPLMRRPEELRHERVNPYHLRDVPGETPVEEPAHA